MTTLDVLGVDGKKAGSVELPADIFEAQVNIPLMHQVVVAQLAAARQGTHKTKTRGEVSGGGRKPYRQKGTGRARQGSIRAPQFAGGGVVHGPVPRDYSQRTPKKMKAAALRSALSDRAREGLIHVVETFVDGETPKTKTALATLAAVTKSDKVLVVLGREDDVSWLSLRNVPRGAPARRRPAQHVRRARFRRGDLHQGGAGGVRRVREPSRPPIRGQRRRGRGMTTVADPRDVIIAPVVSEKSYSRLDGNWYTFLVHPDANKTEIKIAIQQIFNVRVLTVNTLNREGKRKRTRTGWGKRKDTKRAIVKLAEGDRIEAFGGPVG